MTGCFDHHTREFCLPHDAAKNALGLQYYYIYNPQQLHLIQILIEYRPTPIYYTKQLSPITKYNIIQLLLFAIDNGPCKVQKCTNRDQAVITYRQGSERFWLNCESNWMNLQFTKPPNPPVCNSFWRSWIWNSLMSEALQGICKRILLIFCALNVVLKFNIGLRNFTHSNKYMSGFSIEFR